MNENTSKDVILSKIMKTFILTLVMASIGTIIGQFVPPSLFLPLIIFELVILLFALFLRKRKTIGYGFLFFFTFLTGVTSYPVITHYVGELGGQIVTLIFFATLVIFTILGFFGYKTEKNLMNWGGVLLSVLIGLVIVSLFGLFFPLGSALMWIITIGGIILFSAFIIYDFNVIRHQPLTEEDVPLMALNLYLDFLNLFLDLLRLVGLISKN